MPPALRAQGNRVVVAVALVVLLPAIALVERVRPGRGRALARAGIGAVARLCGVRVEVQHAVPLEPDTACILVPNHSSPFDIAAMLVAFPAVRFVAAAELFRIPPLAGARRAPRTVGLERRQPNLARRQLAVLARTPPDGASQLAIFAEGGIAPAGERLPFKTGAFALAIDTGLPVVPVAFHHSDVVLPPHAFLAVRPGTVVVEILEPLATTALGEEDRGALPDRVRDHIVAAPSAGS